MQNYFKMKNHIVLIFAILFLITLMGCNSERNSNVANTPAVDTSEYYDYLLCSGGGYSIVAKQVETVTDVTEYIGILDENYNWVIELETDTPFHSDGFLPYTSNYYSSYKERCSSMKNCLHFAGDGIFILAKPKMTLSGNTYYQVTSWNIPKNESYQSERIRTNTFALKNGYIVMNDYDHEGYVILMDSSGKFIKTDIYCKSASYLGQYAEGVFFSYDGFYDINGNLVIDLSEYAGLIKNNPCFNSGECRLVAENENGTEFVATIDLSGNFKSEFTKMNN